MATKTQLETQLEELEKQLEQVTAERDELAARLTDIGDMQGEVITVPIARSCINCGMSKTVYSIDTGKYRCSGCGHEWTDEEEKAPFRSGARRA